MSSIAGFFSPHTDFSKDDHFCKNTIQNMSKALIRRGPDQQEFYPPRGAGTQRIILCFSAPGYSPGGPAGHKNMVRKFLYPAL
jgi:asparagine synthetase B (glutamine-hydrolysing)